MKLGFIGLGKMGAGMARRLLEKGHDVVTFDADSSLGASLGMRALSLGDLVSKLESPRVIWIMVPHARVGDVVLGLVPHLGKGDLIIDGGNSNYKESKARAKELEDKGIEFLDAGVSGGPEGARQGACIMVGGKKEIFNRYQNLFQDLARPGAYLHVGSAGAGHFVKMVHNGIEYGMMQSLADGFSVLKKSDFNLNLEEIAGLYNHGSVIESRLIAWLKNAYEEFGQQLDSVSGSAAQSGEGTWTLEAAREMNISVPVIESAVTFRTESQKNPSYAGKIISALRNQFGGHNVTSG